MVDMQQAPTAIATPAPPAEAAAPADRRIDLLALQRRDCAPAAGDEVVVCGRADAEPYRLRPLPPLPASSPGLLSRPLRVRIAPGVSLGLQPGGGVGLHAQFGPGKKTDDTASE